MTSVGFPDRHRFAFTILDDTDDFTLTAHRPIYDLLEDLGFRTTKTVWVLDTPESQRGEYELGDTLENPAYLEWLKGLAGSGFEIAFHGASMASSPRARTLAAIAELEQSFPDAMRVYCNHGENRENLYWGRHRYTWTPTSLLSRIHARLTGRPPMDGHIPASEYFWGDVAREKVDYVRSLTFERLDCSRIPPGRPFRDPRRPLVSCWFNTADASAVNQFRRLVTRDAVEDLAANGGWSIVSTHLGKGFVQDGKVDPDVEEILRFIAAEDGWFVPVGALLEHLVGQIGSAPLTTWDRMRSEVSHLLDRARR